MVTDLAINPYMGVTLNNRSNALKAKSACSFAFSSPVTLYVRDYAAKYIFVQIDYESASPGPNTTSLVFPGMGSSISEKYPYFSCLSSIIF